MAIPEVSFRRQAFYTPAEVADILNVHVSTVREYIRTGRLHAFQLSERVTRISLSSLMALLGATGAVTEVEISHERADDIWRQIEEEHVAAVEHA